MEVKENSRTISNLAAERQKRENMIGLLAWLIVMILASMAGIIIGYISKQ